MTGISPVYKARTLAIEPESRPWRFGFRLCSRRRGTLILILARLRTDNCLWAGRLESPLQRQQGSVFLHRRAWKESGSSAAQLTLSLNHCLKVHQWKRVDLIGKVIETWSTIPLIEDPTRSWYGIDTKRNLMPNFGLRRLTSPKVIWWQDWQILEGHAVLVTARLMPIIVQCIHCHSQH